MRDCIHITLSTNIARTILFYYYFLLYNFLLYLIYTIIGIFLCIKKKVGMVWYYLYFHEPKKSWNGSFLARIREDCCINWQKAERSVECGKWAGKYHREDKSTLRILWTWWLCALYRLWGCLLTYEHMENIIISALLLCSFYFVPAVYK